MGKKFDEKFKNWPIKKKLTVLKLLSSFTKFVQKPSGFDGVSVFGIIVVLCDLIKLGNIFNISLNMINQKSFVI